MSALLQKQGIKSTRDVIALNVAGGETASSMTLKLDTKYWLTIMGLRVVEKTAET